ncbi:hypothetical protein B0O80DRAFT_504302 [Mortierella sp. GBAus27b]|nr:hypothetical protein BGX31_011416 [Mortierella sp. GBA43]KAI8345546.1 hypothetical protein B0O80DRAFT_504302 [Mortierella sp. GBAus27b]
MTRFRLTPFDLPHIRESVGQYLSGRDLVHALCINRDWYNSLLPMVWSSVEIRLADQDDDDEQDEDSMEVDNPPPPPYQSLQQQLQRRSQAPPFHDIKTLARHQHLIKSMVQTDSFLLAHHATLFFPRLEKLGLYLDRFQHQPSAANLLARYHSLQHLDLKGQIDFRAREHHRFFAGWTNLPTHLPNLTTLRLDHVAVRGPDSIGFWQIMGQLETVELEDTQLFGPDPVIPAQLTSLIFPRMTCIVLKGPDTLPLETRLLWMSRCPNLVTLKWIPWSSEGLLERRRALDKFAQLVAKGTWPRLVELTMEMFQGSDDQVAKMIRNLRGLRKLDLAHVVFGPASYRALRHHFDTVEELSISSDTPHLPGFESGPWLVEILASCPLLRSFMTGTLRGQDILTGPPRWACESSLEMLGADIDIPPGTWVEERQLEIVERLARLTQLKFFDMSDRHYVNEGTLRLTLAKGLGLLATWTCMEDLFFSGTEQAMTQADVDWMLQHWKRLRNVVGQPNSGDLALSSALEAQFQSRGIKVDVDDTLPCCL